jgi:hypothetical protein
VCRFHVAAGGKLHADKQFIWRPCPECHEGSKHHLLKFGFLLLVRLNLGFITEGRFATVLIILSSWGSQRAVLTSHQSAERSFSKFKLLKNYLRSTMLQDRLNGLTTICIEKKLLDEIDIETIINNLASRSVRRNFGGNIYTFLI